MRLQLATWPEVDNYLQNSTGIIIPIGSTEQHGPTGFIGTDSLCPEMLAFEIGSCLNVMVAPTISIGMAQHHLGFAGSITFRPSTLISMVSDIVNSLSRNGFNRFFFLNGHGGNVATLSAAFSEIYSEVSFRKDRINRPAIRCRVENWWSHESIQDLSKGYFGDAEGSHATPTEVALTYYGYPKDSKRVSGGNLFPKVAPDGPIYDANDYKRRFADGRIGSNPALATVEIGKSLFDSAVKGIGDSYLKFIEEK